MKLSFKDVTDLLSEYSPYKGELKIIELGHGGKYTCLDCRHWYDECVCLHNEIVKKLEELIDKKTFN